MRRILRSCASSSEAPAHPRCERQSSPNESKHGRACLETTPQCIRVKSRLGTCWEATFGVQRAALILVGQGCPSPADDAAGSVHGTVVRTTRPKAAAGARPYFVPGLPPVLLIELRQAYLRTRITASSSRQGGRERVVHGGRTAPPQLDRVRAQSPLHKIEPTAKQKRSKRLA